jgi:hypothetical protein
MYSIFQTWRWRNSLYEDVWVCASLMLSEVPEELGVIGIESSAHYYDPNPMGFVRWKG